MVIGLSITPGQEITASATALTISDTNTVTISATVDERNRQLASRSAWASI